MFIFFHAFSSEPNNVIFYSMRIGYRKFYGKIFLKLSKRGHIVAITLNNIR